MYSSWITRGLESRYRRPALTASRSTTLNPLSDLFTILLVVVVLVGAISREPMIAAPGALAFVIAMVARVWSALSLEEITIDRTSSRDHAFQSDEIEIIFTIENNKPLPVPWLEINEYVPRGMLIEGQKAVEQSYLGGAEIKVSTALRPYERVRIKRKLVALSRGKYRLGKTRLRSGDLFGLYPADASLDHTAWSIYVYPRIQPLLGFSLAAQRPIGDSLARHHLWDDPSRPSGVHEYRPGDPIKNIDWKTTARRNEIFVRQFDPSVSEQIVIFAEAITTNVPWEGYRSDVLEGTMNAAASISSHAIELGYKVGLVTNGVSGSASHAVVTPGTGQDQLTVLLESLAMVHPIAVRTLDEMAKNRRGAISPGSTLIHVGGTYHPRTINYLLELKSLGHLVIILHIGREDPPQFPELEVRDGRSLFLLPSEGAKDGDFRRPPENGFDWKESEMQSAVEGTIKRGSQ